MSFGLAVLAVGDSVDDAAVMEMVDRCRLADHIEGELDERIVGFYERLRTEFPDYPPYPHDSPWMDMPLSVGIDHVFMHLSFSHRGDRALEVIWQLATEYGLAVWDPQDRTVHRP